MKILFIDTETGGLDPNKHSLLSIGLVLFEDNAIIDSTEIYIKEEEYRVTPYAMKINGINLYELYEKGVSPDIAVEKIIDFVSNNDEKKIIVGGHNVNFDIGFLKQLFAKTPYSYNKYISHRYIDVASILKIFTDVKYFDKEVHSLDDAIEYFDIKIENRHSALDDAIATALVYNELKDILNSLICNHKIE